MVSKKFIQAVKLSNKKSYQIAHQANLHPSTLSKILNGIEKIKNGDERVIAIGRVLGLQDDELFKK